MRALLISSSVAAMVFASAAAHAGPAVREEVKIPFAFVVNGQELPAGTYDVREDDAGESALLLQGEGKSVFLLTAPVRKGAPPQDTSFVFAKDGTHYRLSEIWNDEGDGMKIVDASK